MKLTGFDQLLSDVRDFEAELAAPASFYARHREEYFQQARLIAEQVVPGMTVILDGGSTTYTGYSTEDFGRSRHARGCPWESS